MIWLTLAVALPALASRRLIDPAGLFSFVPPPGWSVSMVHTQRESKIRADLPDKEAYLTVSARRLPPGTRWADWEAKFRENLKKSLKEPKFGPFELCGEKALAVVGAAQVNPRMTVERITVHKKGVVYVMTMVYPAAAWTEFRPILEKTLATFACRPPK